MAGNGLELPEDLLVSIGKRLENWINILRFRSICVSWRHSIPPFKKSSVPYVILHPYISHPLSTLDHLPRCSLTATSVYRLEPIHSLPNSPPNKPWFMKVRVNHHKQKMKLLNPVPNEETGLLPLTFPDSIDLSTLRITEIHQSFYFTSRSEKAALISTSGGGVAVVYISYTGLVVDKLGNARFNGYFNTVRGLIILQSIVNFNEKIYALDKEGNCEVVDSYLNMTRLASPKGLINERYGNKYLVESSGELLLVNRYAAYCSFSSKMERGFQVYRLNDEETGWVRVRSLGNRVLVVGSDGSYSISAADFGISQANNCIVFLDDLKRNYYVELHCECGDCDTKAFSSRKNGFPDVLWPLPNWFLSPVRSLTIRKVVSHAVAILEGLEVYHFIIMLILFLSICLLIS